MWFGTCCCEKEADHDAVPAVVHMHPVCQPPPPEEPTVFFTIQVVGVRGIRDSDWLIRDSDWLPGTGKPECVVDVVHTGKSIGSTDVVADSLQPLGTQGIDVMEYNQGNELEFKVYAKDGTGADCLGKIAMKPEQFAADGFNDEVLLEDAGANIQAYLSLKIKPQGKQYPAGPPPTFTVEVKKDETEGYGMMLDWSDETNLMVCGINPGAFADYNKSVEPSQQVRKSDFITLVNEVSTSSVDCLKQFMESKVTCVVTRGIEFSCMLERDNLQKPLGLTFPEELSKKGYGLPISSVSVTEGAAHAYNKCAEEWDKLKAYDRVLSINGEMGHPIDLKAKMENATGKFQVLILRVCSEMSA